MIKIGKNISMPSNDIELQNLAAAAGAAITDGAMTAVTVAAETSMSAPSGFFDNIPTGGGGGGSVTANSIIAALGYTPLSTTGQAADSSLLDGLDSTYFANASNLTTGIVSVGLLGSGTANSTTYLRGDGSWASIPDASSLAATAYSNAVSFAGIIANTAYTNAVTFASTIAGTAYSNAIAFSGNAAAAFANAVLFANTIANTAFTNAIAYSGNAVAAYTNAIATAANATNLSSGTVNAARLPGFGGDATVGAGANTITLANTAVAPGTYGNTTYYPIITVDSKGRITAASTQIDNAGSGGSFLALTGGTMTGNTRHYGLGTLIVINKDGADNANNAYILAGFGGGFIFSRGLYQNSSGSNIISGTDAGWMSISSTAYTLSFATGQTNATALNTTGSSVTLLQGNSSGIISAGYFNPSANTIALGNTTARWIISANTGDFSGLLTGTAGISITSGSRTLVVNSTHFAIGGAPTTFLSGRTLIYGAASAAAPTLGQANGSLQISTSGDQAYGMLFGVDGASGDGWIQQQRVDGTGTAYNLKLQPSGGSVTIAGGTAWHSNNDGTGSGLDADTVDSYQPAVSTSSGTPNTLVLRDASGDDYRRYGNAAYFNSTDDVSTGSISNIMAKFGDNYYRSATATKVKDFLALQTTSNVQFNSLGVGTAGSGTAGEIRATNNITAYYSDDRLKTRIRNIPNALEKLCGLNGFYFEANEIAQTLGYEKKMEVGVSAQEVNAILPEIIAPAPIDEQYMTVRYEKLIPLIIEAIKELRAEIRQK